MGRNGNPLQKASVYVYQSFRKLLGSPEARTDTIYKKLVYAYQAFRKLLLGEHYSLFQDYWIITHVLYKVFSHLNDIDPYYPQTRPILTNL